MTPENTSELSEKKLTGLLLITAGSLLLMQNAGIYIPNWILSWPMLITLLGVVSGIRHRFSRLNSYLFISVGLALLTDRISNSVEFHQVVVPLIFTAIGFYLIIKRNQGCNKLGQEPQY
ncbi:LiaI-LiaF-like domain-containing protein [Pedobacter sp. SYSU D00535]|uniref:LiaF transmembrane domain-containing protein n=1 Tax=Pedobacter sp. SYSU D00535 TaxID=2810308 RepID=UPI001A95FE6E|nr:DUF5668 domain-containing protein [Pedobacter sp. SYSU D00535]